MEKNDFIELPSLLDYDCKRTSLPASWPHRFPAFFFAPFAVENIKI